MILPLLFSFNDFWHPADALRLDFFFLLIPLIFLSIEYCGVCGFDFQPLLSYSLQHKRSTNTISRLHRCLGIVFAYD